MKQRTPPTIILNPVHSVMTLGIHQPSVYLCGVMPNFPGSMNTIPSWGGRRYDPKLVTCLDCGKWNFQGTSQTRAQTALRRHRKHCRGTKPERRAKLIKKRIDAKRWPIWDRLPFPVYSPRA